jgi:bla regulator protein BlaR1
MNELGNHLWQSTIFAAAVAALSFALRKNRARARYWLWLAASLKFVVPFSVLLSLGARLDVPAVAPLPVLPALTVEQITTSFAPVYMPPQPTAARWWPAPLAAVWLAGVLLLAVRWGRAWFELHRLRRAARPLPIAFPIPVLETSSTVEPGVFGLFRPVLLLPEGLGDRLAPEQLDAVLAHELSHVDAHDNLTGALHVAVATVFWFHPAVWFIGRRLIEERERACDEAVLHQGKRPETYAQGILSICRFYKEAPACAAGVTGADLKRRIREIMARRVSRRLTVARKALLATAGFAAVSVPVVIGILRAQTLPPPPAYTYEVVSIKRNVSGENNSMLAPGAQGGMRGTNVTAMLLMTHAYDVRDYQFVGAPGWVDSERFDLHFTPDKPDVSPSPGMPRGQLAGWFERSRHRLRAILRDRFGLVLRAETRDMPMYALMVDRKGHKLKQAANSAEIHLKTGNQQMSGTAVHMKMVADSLAGIIGRYVADETGLDDLYDLAFEWTATQVVPDDSEGATRAGGVSLFTAVTEQLGLKLVSKRGKVPVFVVEKVEKPSEN